MKPAHLALILFIDLIWAFNIVAVKMAIDDAGPLTAVTLRYGVVLIACLPWLRWLPGRMLTVLATGFVAGEQEYRPASRVEGEQDPDGRLAV